MKKIVKKKVAGIESLFVFLFFHGLLFRLVFRFDSISHTHTNDLLFTTIMVLLHVSVEWCNLFSEFNFRPNQVHLLHCIP